MSKKVANIQKRITDLENKGDSRTKHDNIELRNLIRTYPANTDLYIKDETLNKVWTD